MSLFRSHLRRWWVVPTAAAAALIAMLWLVRPDARESQDAAPSPVPEQLPEVSPPGDESAPAAKLPAALQGVDLMAPAQEAFRGWPPQAFLDRPYWLPWTPSALRRAMVFRQPVLLVMTVPWNRAAQRMQSETLADPEVLRAINSAYVSIGVAADRRPDLRERYQTGSWPAVQLLLPDGRPMLSQANPTKKALPIAFGFVDSKSMLFLLSEGRIYFDKWSNVLSGVADVYDERVAEEDLKPGTLRLEAADQVARWLVGNFDARNGGFEAAPKFVIPGLTELAGARQARMLPALSDSARKTLEKLTTSPLWDARDGGIHRMALKKEWGEIQYEKMLVGNAELLREIVFALRQRDSADLRKALSGTASFVTTVLARPGGGFYSAQNADPSTVDGGGYWKSAPAGTPPPVHRLVLSGPNALAGAALLRAGLLAGEDRWRDAGRQAIDLVLSRAYRPGRGVDHVLEPNPEPWRFLVSQSQVAFGLADAYESTGDARYGEAARDIVEFCLNNLRPKGESAVRDHLDLVPPVGLLKHVRHPMEENVQLARVMLRLGALGLGDGYPEEARKILATYLSDLTPFRVHAVEPALAVEEALRDPLVVEISGDPADARTQRLRRTALELPRLWTVVRTSAAKLQEEPSARLQLGDNTRTVTDPSRMGVEAGALASASAGRS